MERRTCPLTYAPEVCQGAVLHNVAVTNVGSGVRYGGIWTATGAPNVGAGSPIEARVAQEVSCARVALARRSPT